MITSTRTRTRKARQSRNEELPLIAIPEPNLTFEQDSEWCVIRDGKQWEEIRFHDYDRIYQVPGLYEHIFYNILQCQSPTIIRNEIEKALRMNHINPADLCVLDLGAGNGMMGEQLRQLGATKLVGVDILAEAAQAALRDHPDLYDDYLAADITELTPRQRERLQSFHFNALTCVAALGFGDIPPRAFTEAYNLLAEDAIVAFNIKEDFISNQDSTGFANLIQRCRDHDVLTIESSRHYQHRIATNGDPLIYVAIIARKTKNIEADWVE